MLPRLKYFLFLFLLFPLTGCLDDDDSVTDGVVMARIDFRAEFGSAPLRIQSATYAYPTRASLKIQLFQYYISDLQLLPADGSDPVQLANIELLRWMSAAEDAVSSRTYAVPAGEYSGLRFGLGVSPDLNAMNPNAFAADFILNENEFWNDATRYVFAKIEANADLENDGVFATPLSYHMGSDAVYTTLSFAEPLRFTGNGDPRPVIVADVLRALASDNEVFDIGDPDQQRVHGGNQAIAADIWNRLTAQFRLEVR